MGPMERSWEFERILCDFWCSRRIADNSWLKGNSGLSYDFETVSKCRRAMNGLTFCVDERKREENEGDIDKEQQC